MDLFKHFMPIPNLNQTSTQTVSYSFRCLIETPDLHHPFTQENISVSIELDNFLFLFIAGHDFYETDTIPGKNKTGTRFVNVSERLAILSPGVDTPEA